MSVRRGEARGENIDAIPLFFVDHLIQTNKVISFPKTAAAIQDNVVSYEEKILCACDSYLLFHTGAVLSMCDPSFMQVCNRASRGLYNLQFICHAIFSSTKVF
ncbi:hypothetical protein RB195_017601 [Necator americanus]|uniref:Uncharacterized protein n=1 Tax=Necator americanus TaxID=51031 RepID=A0ABR1C6Z3_NECAM